MAQMSGKLVEIVQLFRSISNNMVIPLLDLEKSSSLEKHETWSEPFFRGTKTFEDKKHSWNAITDQLVKKQRHLIDQQLADCTVKTLRTLAPQAVAGTQSFFIATGFYKPHFPFVFPESFLGHCRDVELPSNSYAPREMPTIVWSPYMELNSYADIRKLRVSSAMNAPFLDEVAIDLRRAYYATVSYTDSLVGQVFAE
ncbi:hypothetical protein DPMN_085553 [Dreissena polymorpha]|uniref:Uncharacterized protein n=1 Tax=Dreissena polymorpha TaxID=45954 RepID=A0A9D3YCL7_DREPO|nr:hypothetical protein DPMN_085553 [Dreissena polymorpha]